MDTKPLKVLLGDKSLGTTLIGSTYTIKTLKDYGNLVLKQYSLLKPEDFTIDIYLNPQTRLDLSLISDDLVLEPYWSQFTDPVLHIREVKHESKHGLYHMYKEVGGRDYISKFKRNENDQTILSNIDPVRGKMPSNRLIAIRDRNTGIHISPFFTTETAVKKFAKENGIRMGGDIVFSAYTWIE